MRAIVLACGNPLRGDDGIALHLAHQLYGAICDADTEIVCSHQWLPEQAEDLSHADLAIFIDASAAIAAGEVRMEPVGTDAEDAGVTSHSLNPEKLMILAKSLFATAPRRAFLVTIGGESFGHGNEFSEPVCRAIPAALKQVRDLLLGESELAIRS